MVQPMALKDLNKKRNCSKRGRGKRIRAAFSGEKSKEGQKEGQKEG